MDANRRGGHSAWVPVFFSLVLVLGMVIGFNLRDSLRNKRDITAVIQRNDRLEEIIGLIKEKYVDTVSTNRLYQDAVSGILNPLDPHTVYIPADEVAGENEDLEGSFSGIGIEFSILRDTIEVTSVTERGPAAKAGLSTGDQIISVGDSLVAGNGITTERIMRLLRGKQNSTVAVDIRQVDNGRMKEVAITRDVIPIYSVDASIMADEKTGYIKINRFSATTYDEFSRALKQLKSEGAQQMIIDLRDNPGGYLDAATSISDDLLNGDKLIVYTTGHNTPRMEYKAEEKGDFEKGRLAILVDEGSASASEILAGAIQDWDRGVIIGRRTYGKGLVQEQYEMPDGAALRLTIARYYTPSGRSIQRSFAQGRDVYQQDFERRLESGELTGNDTLSPADTTRFYTHNKRVVFGGGGIKPDVYVPYDTTHLSTPVFNMAVSEELKTAIWDYFIQNRTSLRYKSISDFVRSFNSEGQVINRYIALLPVNERKNVLKHFNTPSNQQYFAQHIKAQLARYLFRDNGYYSVKLKDDDVVKRALAVINGPQYSKLLGE